jgi:hypothetical protein
VTNIFENDQTLESCGLLSTELSRCGLTEYFEVLIRNGFDAWNTVLDIREKDLDAMDFKLGHRRKLQRHITNYCSHNTLAQSYTPPFNNNNTYTKLKDTNRAHTLTRVRKRSYNRRPKPDINAPTKPKSGYVLYSNHMRKNPEVAIMPFDAIAKYVGHNWQLLGPKKRKLWEDRPVNGMFAYSKCLDIYKQSKNYAVYQTYLATFSKERKHQLMRGEKVSGMKNESASLNKVRQSFLAFHLQSNIPTDK